MTHHAERLTLPYPPAVIYAIVADVERYPEFLPWVLDARIINQTNQGFLADLTVGYKFYQETYQSEVILTPNERIEVRYIKGPFKHLHNHWDFTPASPTGVDIHFFIDFEFNSSFFQRMIQTLFTQAATKMITAFEDRARILSQKNFF